MTDQPKIRIRDLKKSFGPKVVLDGIDLTIFEEECHCLTGDTGSGKT
ncbi:MAG: ABC transporter ATP-binding protein, partial [Rhodospirillales bacterium]|nr:ABC transporter ATP-binding protein [Rhodospirillales bacterium]